MSEGSRLRRAFRLLEPFLGLAFIFLVFGLYDVLVFATTGNSRPGPITDLLDLFGLDGVSTLNDLGLERFGVVISWANLKSIAGQTTIIALGALGMTLIIVAGGIDLSPGSSIALSTVVIALCLRGLRIPFLSDEPIVFTPTLAALAGVLTAGLVGLANGVLITRLRIVPFIVTLGMMSAARGLAKLFSGEQKVNAPGTTWLNDLLVVSRAPDAPRLEFPTGFWILLALAAILWIVLRYTVFGRYVFAIGSNESTAVLCGVRVRGQKTLIYAVAGLFVGIAAVMEFSVLGTGDPSTAVSKELDIIAAVVIGGASLSGGKGSVVGTLVGAFVIGVLRNGCVLYEIANPVQEIVIGAIIVTAAGIDQIQARRR